MLDFYKSDMRESWFCFQKTTGTDLNNIILREVRNVISGAVLLSVHVVVYSRMHKRVSILTE